MNLFTESAKFALAFVSAGAILGCALFGLALAAELIGVLQ